MRPSQKKIKKKKSSASGKRKKTPPELNINEMIQHEPGRGEDMGVLTRSGPEDGVEGGVLSVSVSTPSALGDRSSASNNYDKLLFEMERMKARCQEMQTAMAGGTVGKSKSKSRKSAKNYTATDKLNLSYMRDYVKDKLYPRIKILLPKFYKYSENKKSISQRVLSVVTLPPGTSMKMYYVQILVGEISIKYGALKSNMIEQFKKQYAGMTLNQQNEQLYWK